MKAEAGSVEGHCLVGLESFMCPTDPLTILTCLSAVTSQLGIVHGPSENKPYFREHSLDGLFQGFEVPIFNHWTLHLEAASASGTYVSSKS